MRTMIAGPEPHRRDLAPGAALSISRRAARAQARRPGWPAEVGARSDGPAVERPVRERLGEVLDCDRVGPGQVGDRPRHLEHAIVGAGREPEPRRRPREELPPRRRQRAVAQRAGAASAARSRVRAPRPRRAHWRSRARATRCCDRRRLRAGRRPPAGPVGHHWPHVDVEVDPVEQRRRQPPEIARPLARRARAPVHAPAAPPARIHRPHQLDLAPAAAPPRRPARPSPRRPPAAGGACRARAGRTPAARPETARPGGPGSPRPDAARGPPPTRPAAETVWWGARNGRRVTRPSGGSSPATLQIRLTSIASPSVRGGRIVGSRRARSVLPVPGGPISSTWWPPAAAISSARFACAWPRTSPRSTSSGGATARSCPGSPRVLAIGCSSLRNAAASASEVTGYTARASSTDASEVLPAARRQPVETRVARPERHREHPAHRMDRPVEGQLPHHEEARQPLGLDRARRRQEPERDRQVEADALLPHVRRREVDGHPLEREREAGVPDRRADALPALAHRGIRQAHRRERGQPLAHVDLDADQRRVDTREAGGEDPREHHPRRRDCDLDARPLATPGSVRPTRGSGLQGALRERAARRAPSCGRFARAGGPSGGVDVIRGVSVRMSSRRGRRRAGDAARRSRRPPRRATPRPRRSGRTARRAAAPRGSRARVGRAARASGHPPRLRADRPEAPPGLHLDEHERRPVAGEEVDLAEPRPEVPREDDEPAPLRGSARPRLPPPGRGPVSRRGPDRAATACRSSCKDLTSAEAGPSNRHTRRSSRASGSVLAFRGRTVSAGSASSRIRTISA